MHQAAVAIPEKLFFKIGEVCDLTGVQAHVLRYWESEFPMLSPQKNRAGQRTYRRRDVEIALRIRELLYEELYTIAGARKKLGSELRGASRLKVVTSDMADIAGGVEAELDEPAIDRFPVPPEIESPSPRAGGGERKLSSEQRDALRNLAAELQAMLKLLDENANRSNGR